MEFRNNRIATSVGYSFAFAALCGMALFPQPALADDDADGASSDAAEASAQSGARVNGAPVADEKSETVYIFANPDGSVKETEVSTTLKNPAGEGSLADSSVLTDIENAEGPNTYSGSGDGMVWDTEGKDVYYTGKTDKKAPVSIKVTYYLDGKETPYDKLAGASGKLKIRYDYDNNATVKAKIKGKEETLYVPFTFVTALMFDNDNFKNAEVTNGKLIDDGDRAIVAGYAIPGLQKSLGKIVDDFDIPDYFEVTADVTDFEMKTSLTIVTAGLMSDLNTDEIDTKELRDASGELSDAMSQILDGTGTLADGLGKLADGARSASKAAGKLADGADKVADGNKELAKGTGKLAKGAGELSEGLTTMQDQTSALPDGVGQLAAGSQSLADGLKEAVKGAKALEDGAGSVKGGLKQLKSGLEDAQNGAKQISGGLTQLKGGTEDNPGLLGAQAGAGQLAESLEGVEGQLSALSDAKEALSGLEDIDLDSLSGLDEVTGRIASNLGVLEGARDRLEANEQQALTDVESDFDTLSAALGSLSGLSESLSTLSSLSDTLDEIDLSGLSTAIEAANSIASGLGDAVAGVDQLVQGANNLDEGLGTAIDNLGDEGNQETLIGGAAAIEVGAAQLKGDEKSGLTAASGGADALAAGLGQLAEKASALIDGVSKIVTGAKQLDEGAGTLGKGADKLAKGAGDLADGAHEFDDGLKALPEGADAAADGAGQLLDGLEEFNEEGIGKITDIIDDDLLPFVDRLDALKDAANDYNNFAGITKGTSGSVKFIIETDAISSEE